MANTYLTRTFSAGNRKTGTISVWLKRSSLAATQNIFSTWNTSANGYTSAIINIASSGRIGLFNYTADGTSTHTEFQSNASYRDVSGWYHIVFSWNTTLSTASDRYKLYVNGERITSFSTATYPTLNEDLYFDIGGSSNPVSIGSEHSGGGGGYFNGLMSHYHHTDGTAYDASAFGETDATTGEWKIKTSPSVTYGTNGFFILKDGNGITDQSTNSNDFSLGGGTITKTEDNPSNVFNVLNPLDGYQSNYTYAQGNTAVASSSGSRTYVTSTLGMPSGKYYWECKLDATIGDGSGGASTSVYVGITGQNPISPSQFPSDGTCFNCVMNTNGQVYSNGSTIGSALGSGWSSTTIVMMAYDADNNKMYFGKDGTWLNSGDPTSGSTGTGAFTPTTAASATPIGVYMPQWGVDAVASYGTSFNFGNGYFGTTAVSSAGTNASGNGIFEYDVPTGYTALSTKGLNL